MEAFQGKLHYFCSAFVNAHWLWWQGLSIGAAVTSSLSFCDFSHPSSILVFILVLEPRATKSGATQAWSLKPSCEPWFRTITWASSRLCEPRLSPLDNGESENRLSLRWYHRKLERFSHTLAPCWVLLQILSGGHTALHFALLCPSDMNWCMSPSLKSCVENWIRCVNPQTGQSSHTLTPSVAWDLPWSLPGNKCPWLPEALLFENFTGWVFMLRGFTFKYGNYVWSMKPIVKLGDIVWGLKTKAWLWTVVLSLWLWLKAHSQAEWAWNGQGSLILGEHNFKKRILSRAGTARL